MKRNTKIIFSSLLSLVMMFLMTNCKDDEGLTVSIDDQDKVTAYHLEYVTITGTNYDLVTSVFIGYKEVPFEVEGNALTFMVVEEATPGDNIVTLVMPGNYRVTTMLEVLIRPVPIIADFDPYVGIGNDMTITGTGFEYNASVAFDGVSAAVVSASATELVVTVPSGISDVDPVEILITNDFGTGTNKAAFIARQGLVVDAQMSQGEGNEFTAFEKLNGGDQMTEVTGSDAYAGGRSMRVVGAAGNPWDTQLATTPMQLTFGETYTAIVWAKAEGAGAQMRVSISQWDGNGADYFYGETVDLSTSWAPYTWTFTVGQDLAEHKLVLDMGMTNVPFLIDHVSVLPGELGVEAGKPELLTNGSFEDDLTGWESLNGDHTVTTDDAYCGSKSLTVTGTGGNPWDVQMASDPMDLTEGNLYEISFWAKAAGADGVFRISMSQWDGSGSDFFYSDDLSIPEEWAYFSFVVEAQNVPSGVYRLLFDMGATTQTFFVDAVSVKEYDGETSLYENGGFEDGLTNWESLNGTHEVTTAEYHSGSACLSAIGAGANPWDTQIASDPVALIPDTDYKISFWAKAAGADGVFRISMSQWDGNGSDFFYSDDFAIPEEWTFFSVVITAQATATGDHRLLFDMGATTQTFFVDDVTIVEYNACE